MVENVLFFSQQFLMVFLRSRNAEKIGFGLSGYFEPRKWKDSLIIL